MKRLLITGSNGLIGKKLVEKLKNDYKIIEIDREKSKSIEFQNLIGFSEKINVIIHLASNCMIRNIIKNPNLAFDNVWNNFNIFELARKSNCKKIVFFSSSRVTSNSYNPYTASKLYGESLAKAYKDCYDINYLIIRPETVWGVKEKKPRVIPCWIKQAQNNKNIIIYGDKNKALPPIYVNDFVDLFLPLFKNFMNGLLNNKTISITGSSLKATKIIAIIKKLTNSKSKIIFKDAEKGQPQQYAKNNNQLISKIPFKNALKNALKNEQV